MLDQSEGESCQANNFLRAFRTLREASALGLLLSWDEEELKTNLGKLIQSWTRFVLQQLNQEMDPQQSFMQSQAHPSRVPLATPTSYMAMPSPTSFNVRSPITPTTPSVQLGMGLFLDGPAGDAGEGGEGGGLGGGEGEEVQTSVMQRVFGSTMKTEVRCGCGWSTITQRTELLFSLHYPHNSTGDFLLEPPNYSDSCVCMCTWVKEKVSLVGKRIGHD